MVLAVVVVKTSPVSGMSLDSLRRIFLSQRVDDVPGPRPVPLNHPARTTDRVGFDRTVLGMGPDDVGRYWIDRRVRGGAPPPRTVDDPATLSRLIEKLPGAISYLRGAQVDGEKKALAIDGKLPHEKGYPIVYRP